MFIPASFTIAKTLKRVPSNKGMYKIYMDIYGVYTQWNIIQARERTWMDLEHIMQNEISQTETK